MLNCVLRVRVSDMNNYAGDCTFQPDPEFPHYCKCGWNKAAHGKNDMNESTEAELKVQIKVLTQELITVSKLLGKLRTENERLLVENNALRSGKIAAADITRIAENIGYSLDRSLDFRITKAHTMKIAECLTEEFGPGNVTI